MFLLDFNKYLFLIKNNNKYITIILIERDERRHLAKKSKTELPYKNSCAKKALSPSLDK